MQFSTVCTGRNAATYGDDISVTAIAICGHKLLATTDEFHADLSLLYFIATMDQLLFTNFTTRTITNVRRNRGGPTRWALGAL